MLAKKSIIKYMLFISIPDSDFTNAKLPIYIDRYVPKVGKQRDKSNCGENNMGILG